ncbi:hypothetical protein [Streptomyces chromofuscus]|uniref:hypothetical protein n=1 Tax=Streptomyces chromofuscus TaxID=42881 RepID=UPI00167571E6|nr:hypothetical protein [Streptomyces chromofuscus]
MPTVFDRYFALLDSDADTTEFDNFEEIFAPDAEVFYGGEYASGKWIAHFHQQIAGRKRHSTHTFSVTAGSEDTLTAEWREVGVDLRGAEYQASGVANALLDSTGRITRLSLNYTDHSDFAWRALRAHNQAWRESDPRERETKIKEAYSENFTFVEQYVVTGHEAYIDWVVKIHEFAPVAMLHAGQVLRNRDFILWEWFFVSADGVKASGWETQHVDAEGKIDQIVVYSNDMATIVGGAA